MSYSTVFTSTNVNPTNNDLKNGHTVDVTFAHSSGTLPTAGAVLKSIKMTWSLIYVYGSNRKLSSIYGTFHPSYSKGSHSGSLTNAQSSILQFTGGVVEFVVMGASSGTANALNVREGCTVTMTVEWEARNPSTGTLSSTEGMLGKTITLDITTADPAFSHTVCWTSSPVTNSDGSVQANSVLETLDPGVTSTTFTIPEDWPVGDATVKLSTYLDEDLLSPEYTYPWTVVVDPEKVYPTQGNFYLWPSDPPCGWSVHVPGIGYVTMSASIGAGTSAYMAQYEFHFGKATQVKKLSSLSNNLATVNFRMPTEPGTYETSVTGTNSFGNSLTLTGDPIYIYPYKPPQIVTCIAYRCLEDGTPNEYGTYIAASVTAAIDSVNGENSIVALQVQYKATTDTEWSTGVELQSGITSYIDAGLQQEVQYEARFVLIDELQDYKGTNTTKTVSVLTSECILFFKDGGLNVSIGTQGTRDYAIEINENWSIWKGDRQLDGVTPIEYGGTGGSTVAEARNALGLGNTDGPLPVENGGTGATTPAELRKVLGLSDDGNVFSIEAGGTGASNAADARENLGITPENIGAAPTSHNHNASCLNEGTMPAARLPFKMCAGTFTVNGSASTDVSFSDATYAFNLDEGFSSAPMVIVSFAGNAPNASGNPGAIKAHSITTSGFQCVYGATSTTDREAMYIAFGT